MDSSGVYIGATSENIDITVAKVSLNGNTKLFGAGNPVSMQAPLSLGVAGTTMFQLYGGSVYRSNSSTGVPLTPNNAPLPVAAGGENPSDMAVNSASLIFSYPTAGLVRWLDSSGAETRSVSVPGAKTVDVAADGTVYVISGTALRKIAPGATTATTIVSTGLASPRRAAVNPTSGDIYVVDCAQYGGGQIKRFSSAGALLQTYGAAGGRTHGGLYQNKKTDFRGAVDIAVEADGKFWVAEGEVAPRRTARFNQSGTWISELYGGQHWAPFVMPEPDNPRYVWVGSQNGDMMRCDVDYATKTWTVHSTYGYYGLANGLVPNHDVGVVWEARVRNGQLYLCRITGYPVVIKVDRTNWNLLPAAVAIGNLSHDSWTYPQWARDGAAAADSNCMLWTDANGDGLALNANGTLQTGETQFFPRAVANQAAYANNSSVDSNLNWISAGGSRKFSATSVNAVGAPVYSTFPLGETGVASPPRMGGAYDDRWSTFTTSDDQGNTWGAFNPNITGWGSSSDAFIARWNPNGSLAWQSGRIAPGQPGSLGSVRRIYGVINNGTNYNCLVVGRFSNEWPSQGVTPIYVYDQDGLYAGHLIGQPVNQGTTPNWRYSLGGEGLAGQIFKHTDSQVYFFGNWINEGRVYKITGWNNWQRANGAVSVPAGYTAPALIPEPIGPNSNGTGLLAQYWNNFGGDTDPGFQGNPVMTRIDATAYLNRNATNPVPGGWPLYSIRWTGTLTPRRTGWHSFHGDAGSIWIDNVFAFPSSGPGKAQWLVAGQAYPIKVEYVYRPGANVVNLQWAEPETDGLWTPVPQSQLSPGTGNPILSTTSWDTTSETAFPASSTDLINAGAPTLASRVETGHDAAAGTSANALNDGTVGANGTLASIAYDPDSTWTSTFTLNTTTNTAGYDINEINVFSGWAGGAVNQKFEVLYTTVTNPTPVSLGTYEYVLDYTTANAGTSTSAKQVIRQSTGALATGVKTLIFSIKLPTSYLGNTASVYRELDAFGTPTPTTGTGLKAQYYNGTAFNTLTLTRTDPTVNFNWGTTAPSGTSQGADNYSIRWSGKVKPQYSQTYTFTTTTDDGVKLWVNNQLLIDKWVNQGAVAWQNAIALTANQLYDIKMEYYENIGSASAKLEWQSPSLTKQVIPATALYPAP